MKLGPHIKQDKTTGSSGAGHDDADDSVCGVSNGITVLALYCYDAFTCNKCTPGMLPSNSLARGYKVADTVVHFGTDGSDQN